MPFSAVAKLWNVTPPSGWAEAGTAAAARARPATAETKIRFMVLASSNGDLGTVETGERAAGARLGEERLLIAQDADRELLAEAQRFPGVRAPVDAGDVAAGGDVRGELVELASDGERRPLVRLQGQAVRRGDDRLADDEILVVEPLEDGHAGAGHGRVARRVGRVGRGPFRERHGHQARAVLAEHPADRVRLQDVPVQDARVTV